MSNLKTARARAYRAQSGRCCYCGAPTWLTDLETFARKHSLRLRGARWFQATAEHLVARQDGGGAGDNIAVACRFCNHHRHARKGSAPTPDAYRQTVRRRLALGRWWPPGLRFSWSEWSGSDFG
jgi:5-methylcytosine-specific restriction endonuclease McrA